MLGRIFEPKEEEARGGWGSSEVCVNVESVCETVSVHRPGLSVIFTHTAALHKAVVCLSTDVCPSTNYAGNGQSELVLTVIKFSHTFYWGHAAALLV
jgi:hypothetical protein